MVVFEVGMWTKGIYPPGHATSAVYGQYVWSKRYQGLHHVYACIVEATIRGAGRGCETDPIISLKNCGRTRIHPVNQYHHNHKYYKSFSFWQYSWRLYLSLPPFFLLLPSHSSCSVQWGTAGFVNHNILRLLIVCCGCDFC